MSCCRPRLSNLFDSCWNACQQQRDELQKHMQHTLISKCADAFRYHTFLMKDMTVLVLL